MFLRFRDFGSSENFSNCSPDVSTTRKNKQLSDIKDTNTNAISRIKQKCATPASESISSSSNITDVKLKPQGINADSYNLSLNLGDKLIIISILKEGWKRQTTFERRVGNKVPQAQQSSMEEIIFAVFDIKSSEFVEFSMNLHNNLQVKINEQYTNLDTCTIMQYVQVT